MIVKSVEKKEKNTVTFTVEVDGGQFEAELQKAYLKRKKSITVPGFRKGKAPRMIIEGMYGTDVFHEDAVEEISPAAFDFAVEQEQLKPVGRPKLEDMQVGEDKTLTLTFESAIYPEVILGGYRGLEAPKAETEVTDEQIDKEIETVRMRNSRLITIERPAQDGDIAVIDYEGSIDGVPFDGGKGENHSLTLGSGQFIPGFEEQVIGMSAGDERDIKVTFPEEYYEQLAGKDAVFHVKANEIKFNEIPELDDEFVKDVSEFDTLEEYKASIRERLLKDADDKASEDYKGRLIQKAVDNMTAEIPDAMVDERQTAAIREFTQNLASRGLELDQYLQITGMDLSSFYQSLRPSVTFQLQSELLLSKIAETEAIEVTEEEIDAEYDDIAASYSMEIDKVKEAIPAETIADDLKRKKAAEIIYSTGIPTEMPPEEEKIQDDIGDEDKEANESGAEETAIENQEAEEE